MARRTTTTKRRGGRKTTARRTGGRKARATGGRKARKTTAKRSRSRTTRAKRTTTTRRRKARRTPTVARGRLAKALVFRGARAKTVGGLTKANITRNKAGIYVSKAKSARGKRNAWTRAV